MKYCGTALAMAAIHLEMSPLADKHRGITQCSRSHESCHLIGSRSALCPQSTFTTLAEQPHWRQSTTTNRTTTSDGCILCLGSGCPIHRPNGHPVTDQTKLHLTRICPFGSTHQLPGSKPHRTRHVRTKSSQIALRLRNGHSGPKHYGYSSHCVRFLLLSTVLLTSVLPTNGAATAATARKTGKPSKDQGSLDSGINEKYYFCGLWFVVEQLI